MYAYVALLPLIAGVEGIRIIVSNMPVSQVLHRRRCLSVSRFLKVSEISLELSPKLQHLEQSFEAALPFYAKPANLMPTNCHVSGTSGVHVHTLYAAKT